MKVTSISVNCGNDRSGIEANIRQILTTEEPDIVTIHAQEVNFKAEKKAIEDALKGSDYGIVNFPARITRTKADVDVLLGNTGLCNFMIYNTKKYHKPTSTGDKSYKSVSLNRASNKGALINRVELRPLDVKQNPIRLALIAGHLDSNSQTQRLGEWREIHKELYPESITWEELAKNTQDMTIGGFDANVRFALEKPNNDWTRDGNEETKFYQMRRKTTSFRSWI